MAGFGQVRSDVFDRVSRSQYYRDHLAGLTAHQRHQRLLAELNKGGLGCLLKGLVSCELFMS